MRLIAQHALPQHGGEVARQLAFVLPIESLSRAARPLDGAHLLVGRGRSVKRGERVVEHPSVEQRQVDVLSVRARPCQNSELIKGPVDLATLHG